MKPASNFGFCNLTRVIAIENVVDRGYCPACHIFVCAVVPPRSRDEPILEKIQVHTIRGYVGDFLNKLLDSEHERRSTHYYTGLSRALMSALQREQNLGAC